WAGGLRTVLASPDRSPPSVAKALVPGSPKKPLQRGTPTASTRVTRDQNVSEGSAPLERQPPESVVDSSAQERPVVPRPVAPLMLAERRLALPLGETRAVRVSGVTGALVMEGGTPVAEAILGEGDRADSRRLQVRGLAAGRTAVRLRMGEQTAELAIRVM